MKNYFVYIFLLIFVYSFPQNLKRVFSKYEMEKEIGAALNNYRKELGDSLNQLDRLSILDSACRYHNDYLGNLNMCGPDKSFTINHSETKTMKGLTYTGKKPLIYNHLDRVRLYDRSDSLVCVNEVIAVNNHIQFFYLNDRLTLKTMAKHVIDSWVESPGHKRIIELSSVDYFGVDVYIHKDNFLCVVLVVASDYNKRGYEK